MNKCLKNSSNCTLLELKPAKTRKQNQQFQRSNCTLLELKLGRGISSTINTLVF